MVLCSTNFFVERLDETNGRIDSQRAGQVSLQVPYNDSQKKEDNEEYEPNPLRENWNIHISSPLEAKVTQN